MIKSKLIAFKLYLDRKYYQYENYMARKSYKRQFSAPPIIKNSVCFYINSSSEVCQTLISMGNCVSIENAPLFISPGNYSFEGGGYELRDPGNYYFIHPYRGFCQRVIIDDKSALNTAKIISRLFIRGTRHQGQIISDLRSAEEVAKRQFVSCICAQSSVFVRDKLNALGFISRSALTFSASEKNFYNDGHHMVEVLDGDKWILVDVDKKVLFEKDSMKLNLLEFVDLVKNGEGFSIQPFDIENKIDWSGFSDKVYNSSFNFQFIELLQNFNLEAKLTNYKSICSLPALYDTNGKMNTLDFALEGSTKMDRNAFVSKFYKH